MLDMQDIANEYEANKALTIGKLAARRGMKAVDVAAILRLQGVTIRRGNAAGLTEEARARGLTVRRENALRRNLEKLMSAYSIDEIDAVLEVLHDKKGNSVGARAE